MKTLLEFLQKKHIEKNDNITNLVIIAGTKEDMHTIMFDESFIGKHIKNDEVGQLQSIINDIVKGKAISALYSKIYDIASDNGIHVEEDNKRYGCNSITYGTKIHLLDKYAFSAWGDDINYHDISQQFLKKHDAKDLLGYIRLFVSDDELENYIIVK